MNVITTTQLRTKSSRLVEMLLLGRKVDLIHRSKIVGEILPSNKVTKPLGEKDVEDIIECAKGLGLSKLSDKEIENRYRKYLAKRYGESLS